MAEMGRHDEDQAASGDHGNRVQAEKGEHP